MYKTVHAPVYEPVYEPEKEEEEEEEYEEYVEEIEEKKPKQPAWAPLGNYQKTTPKRANKNDNDAAADTEKACEHACNTARRQHCDSENNPFLHVLVPNQRPSESA